MADSYNPIVAGHSRWANIKHKKAAADKKRGKTFSMIAKALMAAARAGGGDPADNLALRIPLDRARAANMPRDTIERAIKKGTGELAGEEIHEVIYEAYGPGGAGILILAITDNLNRTVPEVRGVLEKRGGTLGKPGSVAWNFEKKALFTVRTATVAEDRLLEIALEAGADDVRNEGESFAIVAPPEAFTVIADRLQKEGIAAETSDVTYVAKSPVPLSPGDARRVVQLVEALEDLEDVQSAITNADIPEDVLAELALG